MANINPLVVANTVHAVTAAVAEARANNLPVYPVGGRTAWDVGGYPTTPGTELDLNGLNALVDYPAKDMTITVEAGMTVQAMAAELAKENQWLPVDVPHFDRATIGGALATNASSGRRYGYGTLRDYVIGISFVTDEALLVKGGGRVVKNVAGYDLMKLHIGALGTLGIITQVTFKVKPKPEANAKVTFAVEPHALAATLDALHASASRPVLVDVLNQSACHVMGMPAVKSKWYVYVGFEEKAVTVDWQAATLQEEMRKAGVVEFETTPAKPMAEWCQQVADFQSSSPETLVWKANVLPSKTADFLAFMKDTPVVAHALNGIVWGQVPVQDEATTVATIQTLLQQAVACGGNMVVRGGPPAWRGQLPLWGQRRGDYDLMKHIKKTMDPRNMLNPGRFL